MTFLSTEFYLFFPLFFCVYYLSPIDKKYIVICIGSYLFYGFFNLKLPIVLFFVTIISYFCGKLIVKYKTKRVLLFGFLFSMSILLYFKYYNFIVQCINDVFVLFGVDCLLRETNSSVLPVGLSFIVFQAVTYLVDLFKGNIKEEKNFIRYAAFVSFFPTILSGPIQKSRNLLPQIVASREFNAEAAKKGTVIFIYGLFEKIIVSNNILPVIDKIYRNYQDFNPVCILIAAVCFSIYIYADFSAYSDMARGLSKILGITIEKNFKNPYLATSTAEFWNRWHISLNEWFIENLYIPLGGNRKGLFRKYINIFTVFLVSGLWHGAAYSFLVWGGINGLFVIIGQIIDGICLRLKIQMCECEEEWAVLCKRLVVFILITFSWIFFYNDFYSSVEIIKKLFSLRLIQFFDSNLLLFCGSVVSTIELLIIILLFIYLQIKIGQGNVYAVFVKQPIIIQSAVMAMVICVMIFNICSTDANVDANFLYFKF